MNRLRSISGDCARLGYVPTFKHADCVSLAGHISDAVKCHGIFGSGDKVQTTQNTQIGASEDAVQAAGSNSIAAKDDTRVIGVGAVGAQDGSTVISGSSVVGTGLQSSNVGGDVTIGYSGGEFQTALQQVGSNLTEAVRTQSAAGKSTLDAVLSQLSDLAESKQTDGESGKNQIVLYVVFGVLALLGWMLYRK